MHQAGGVQNLLGESFVWALENQDAKTIVEKFGTHVIMGGKWGVRLDYDVAGEGKDENSTTETSNALKLKLGVKFGAYSGDHEANYDWNSKIQETFKESTFKQQLKLFGGDPSGAVEALASISSGSNTAASSSGFASWAQTISGKNDRWMDFSDSTVNEALFPITDFILDPVKKAEVANYLKDTYFPSKNFSEHSSAKQTFEATLRFCDDVTSITQAENGIKGFPKSGGDNPLLFSYLYNNKSSHWSRSNSVSLGSFYAKGDWTWALNIKFEPAVDNARYVTMVSTYTLSGKVASKSTTETVMAYMKGDEIKKGEGFGDNKYAPKFYSVLWYDDDVVWTITKKSGAINLIDIPAGKSLIKDSLPEYNYSGTLYNMENLTLTSVDVKPGDSVVKSMTIYPPITSWDFFPIYTGSYAAKKMNSHSDLVYDFSTKTYAIKYDEYGWWGNGSGSFDEVLAHEELTNSSKLNFKIEAQIPYK